MRLHCWLMWATLPVRPLGSHGSPMRLLGMLHEHAACTDPACCPAALQLANLLSGCGVARHAVRPQCKP
jgi:hypothetical protein